MHESNTPEIDTYADGPISCLLELAGHPWDSFKEHSDFSPCLLMSIFDILREEGCEFVTRLNFRGRLDTLFFQESTKECGAPLEVDSNCAQIYFTLCHQNCIRAFGGSPEFSSWLTSLVKQIWMPGVVHERHITLSPLSESGEIDGIDVDESEIFEYTEIKLSGNPWYVPEWNKDSLLASQYMITRFVNVLSLIGWTVVATVNMYCSPYDKGFLLFEKRLVS